MSRKHALAVAACSAAASVAVLAGSPAAVAAVAHPKAGSYAQIKNNKSLMSFTLSKGYVKQASHYDKCVVVPIMMPNIKVTNGKFSFDGKRVDVIGQKWKVHLDGKFVTKTKAKGTWSAKQLVGGSCTSTFTYTVTWQAG